jgi:hypothetical protein
VAVSIEGGDVMDTCLGLNDLVVHAGEPRISDIKLGEMLGFDRTLSVRVLIKRHAAELRTHGPLHQVDAMVEIGSGAFRKTLEYWLNEAQALLICMFARTEKAAQIRAQIIAVFTAWRRGELDQKRFERGQAPVLIEQEHLRAVEVCLRMAGKDAAYAMWHRLGLPEIPRPEPGNIATWDDGDVSKYSSYLQWFEEMCIPDGRVRTRSSELKESYDNWAAVHRHNPATSQALGRFWMGLGLRSFKSNGVKFWTGVRLRTDKDLSKT